MKTKEPIKWPNPTNPEVMLDLDEELAKRARTVTVVVGFTDDCDIKIPVEHANAATYIKQAIEMIPGAVFDEDLMTSIGGGGKIILRSGIYTVSSTIELTYSIGIVIEGEGNGTTIRATQTSYAYDVFSLVTTKRCQIKNINFRGINLDGSRQVNAISIVGAGSEDFTISDNHITGFSNGIVADSSSGGLVSNNQVQNCLSAGFRLSGSSISVRENTSNSHAYRGFKIGAHYSSSMIFEGNFAYANYVGLEIEGNHNLVANNQIVRSTNAHIIDSGTNTLLVANILVD